MKGCDRVRFDLQSYYGRPSILLPIYLFNAARHSRPGRPIARVTVFVDARRCTARPVEFLIAM